MFRDLSNLLGISELVLRRADDTRGGMNSRDAGFHVGDTALRRESFWWLVVSWNQMEGSGEAGTTFAAKDHWIKVSFS